MPKPKFTQIFDKIYNQEQENIFLYFLVLFSFGILFFLSFQANFLKFFPYFVAVLLFTTLLIFFNLKSLHFFIFSACFCFLLGCFYAVFYEKFILNYTQINGKVFLDGFGKVLEIKEKTDSEKINIILTNLTLCKSNFSVKNYNCGNVRIIDSKNEDKKEYVEKKPKKLRKSTIANNFMNLANYQEINREFLDKKENYQIIEWQEKFGQKLFPLPPPKISISLRKKNENLEVNDIISFRALFDEVNNQNLFNKFDAKKYQKLQKIGGYGFAIGNVEIVKKGKSDNINEYFLSLRSKISKNISKVISGDESEILKALIIGKKDSISNNLKTKIKNSGLSHLLAISGLHLSIVASIFFVLFRKILAFNPYLALNFDLKKISAILAILASFFYLKISGSPITAQRAFLMILLGFIAVFVDEKADFKRILIIIALSLIVINPYVIFSVSFQLSFVAIISIAILAKFYQQQRQQSFLSKFFNYFLAIIIISLFVQITTSPILISNFGSLPILGFLSNLVAIPLVTIFILPIGFLALFLMTFGIEKFALILVGKAIFYLIKLIEFFGDLRFATIELPFEFGFLEVFLSILALLLFYLANSKLLKVLAILIFITAFFMSFFVKINTKLPNIIFNNNGQYFAIYDEKLGLIFNKKPRSKNEIEAFRKYFKQSNFNLLKNISDIALEGSKFKKISCEKERCLIETFDENYAKIIILLTRSKVDEICDVNYNLVVNLSSKYLMPNCKNSSINFNKLNFENNDFGVLLLK